MPSLKLFHVDRKAALSHGICFGCGIVEHINCDCCDCLFIEGVQSWQKQFPTGSKVQFILRLIVPVSVSHSQSILASLLFHGSTSLYLTLLASIKATSLYLTLHYSTMALLFILDSTLIFHSSTSLYMTLMPSTIALFHSIWLYITMALLHSTWLYITNSELPTSWYATEWEIPKNEWDGGLQAWDMLLFSLYNEIYVKKRQRLHK